MQNVIPPFLRDGLPQGWQKGPWPSSNGAAAIVSTLFAHAGVTPIGRSDSGLEAVSRFRAASRGRWRWRCPVGPGRPHTTGNHTHATPVDRILCLLDPARIVALHLTSGSVLSPRTR